MVLIGIALTSTHGREVQTHGLWFERWLCNAFFDGYRPGQYTQKWDIPAAANTRHGHLPVNPKAAKFGSSIGLGDALRQFQILTDAESFLLIVGFWDQSTPTRKDWVNVQAVSVTPERWQKLWHPVTQSDLEQLNATIKNPALRLDEARAQAHAIKSRPPFTQSVIQVNPKLDRNQRRLQCSLSFNAFFDHLAPGTDRTRQARPVLWNQPVPPVPDSAARDLDAGTR
jgi:hypothetical protein